MSTHKSEKYKAENSINVWRAGADFALQFFALNTGIAEGELFKYGEYEGEPKHVVRMSKAANGTPALMLYQLWGNHEAQSTQIVFNLYSSSFQKNAQIFLSKCHKVGE